MATGARCGREFPHPHTVVIAHRARPHGPRRCVRVVCVQLERVYVAIPASSSRHTGHQRFDECSSPAPACHILQPYIRNPYVYVVITSCHTCTCGEPLTGLGLITLRQARALSMRNRRARGRFSRGSVECVGSDAMSLRQATHASSCGSCFCQFCGPSLHRCLPWAQPPSHSPCSWHRAAAR